MLFINEDRIRLEVRSAREAVYDLSGRLISPEVRALYAQFERNTAPDYAREYADKIYVYPTKPEGVTNGEWLCCYDSEDAQMRFGWDDEERKEIEQALMRGGYVHVERSKVEPPWPNYDQLVAGGRGRTQQSIIDQIVSVVDSLGIDPAKVVAYERENLNRPGVLEAMDQYVPTEPEDDNEPLIAA